MREFRLVIFLVVGVLLGGGCSAAFAARTSSATSMGMGFNVRAPSNVAVSGFYDGIVPGFDWTYDPYSSADTKISRAAHGSVGGAPLSGTASRVVSAANIAKVGVKLAKLSGPVSLGLTLSQLIWDEVAQQWKAADSSGGQYDSHYWIASGTSCGTAAARCLHDAAGQVACASGIAGSTYLGVHSGAGSPSHYVDCSRPPNTGYTDHFEMFISRSVTPVEVSYHPATDQEIEDAIYVELVARGMSSDLARRLVDAGYAPDLLPGSGPSITSGPSSLTGPTSTSTTSTSAGTTTITNTTNYNITYQGDTVTVTETTTSTKTNPDNTTETTTETKTPSPTTGEEPAEDVPPEQPPEFCELHPESIVCQEMDTPDENKPNPTEKTFSITPSGGFGGAGACPADVALTYLGQPISWSYQPACDFFTGVRPAVVAMAWVAAILIALGGYRKGD